MHQLDRRELLKTTGVGAGIALGAGSTAGSVGAGSTPQPADDDTKPFTATADSATVGVSVDDPSNPLADPTELTGDGIEISGEIDTAERSWEGTGLDLGDVTEILVGDDLNLDQLVEDLITDLDLDGAAQNILLDDVLDDLVLFIETLDLSDAQIDDHLLPVVSELLIEFLGTDAIIIDFVEDLFKEPDKDTLQSLIEFVIDDIDWETATLQDLLDEFLEEGESLEALVLGFLADTDLDALVADLVEDVEIVPEFDEVAIGGGFDADADAMTIEPENLEIEEEFETDEFTVGISIALTDQETSLVISIDNEALISVELPALELELTTTESGALEGDAVGLDDDTEATATFVENEFTVGIDQINADELVGGIDVDGLLDVFADDIADLLAFGGFPEDYSARLVPESGLSDEEYAILDVLSEDTLGNVVAEATAEVTVDGDDLLAEDGPAVQNQSLDFPAQSVDEETGTVTVENVDSGGEAAYLFLTYDEVQESLLSTTEEEEEDTIIAGYAQGTWSGEDVDVDIITLDRDVVEDGLTSLGLNANLDAMNIEQLLDDFKAIEEIPLDELFVDESGYHAMEVDTDISFDVGLDMGPIGGAPNPPADLNDDGLYEDIRGDGEVGIFDVQTLFANLDDDELQANSEYFNFAGDNPDEVGIFDVQALFNMT